MMIESYRYIRALMRLPLGAVMAMALIWTPIAAADQAAARPLTWITLGTAGGPAVQPDRFQPANLLLVDGKPVLVDVGDGAVERLAGAGFTPAQVDTVVLSHLHVDHIAGLFGLIALRWFTRGQGQLTVYGPPATDALVGGIVAALQPAQRIGIGIDGPGWNTPIRGTVRIVTVVPGRAFEVGGGG